MRQVSAALAAAIEAPERTTRLRLSVDWAGDGHGGAGSIDDLSGRAASVSLSRTLQADVPDEVRTVEGSVVAALDVDLVGGDTTDERISAARYFSRFNTASPLYGLERIGRDVRCDVELLTADGWQAVPRMRGQVRGMPVAAGQRQARLTAMDYRDRLRVKVTLPAVIADAGQTTPFDTERTQAPGLEPSWVVSFVLAANGVYVSPPPRPGCRLWMPFHGSAFPMLGDLVIGVGQADVTDIATNLVHRAIEFASGPYLLGTETLPAGESLLVNTTSTRNLDSARLVTADGHVKGRIEFWARAARYSVVPPIEVRVESFLHGGDVTIDYRLSNTTNAFKLDLVSGVTPQLNLDGPAPIFDGEWHFYGVYIDSAAGIAVFRVDTTDTVVAYTPWQGVTWRSTGDEAYDVYVQAYEGNALAELQVTGGTAQGDVWLNDPAYAWTPGAVIDRSRVPLQGIAIADPQDSWEILDELAAACLGAVWYDEDGMLQWATSARLVADAAQRVQRTVTSATDIVDLAYEDRADALRNRVICPYSPIVLHAAEVMWTAAQKFSVPPHGVVALYVEFDGQFVTAPGVTLAANTSPDGSGIDISGYVSAFAATPLYPTSRSAIYTVSNVYPGTAWLVDTNGDPAVVAAGDWIEQTSGPVPPDLVDATVLDGTVLERPLEVPSNVWVQDRSHAAGVAMALLCQLRDPQQPITALEIPADPRLQFYDRVQISDQHQTMLDAGYWVTGVDERVDADGSYMQQLSARQARDRFLPGSGRVGVDIAG